MIPSKIKPVSLSHFFLSYVKPDHIPAAPAICASIQAIVSSLIYSLFALINAYANGLDEAFKSIESNSGSL